MVTTNTETLGQTENECHLIMLGLSGSQRDRWGGVLNLFTSLLDWLVLAIRLSREIETNFVNLSCFALST